jgi:hypothetical protein
LNASAGGTFAGAVLPAAPIIPGLVWPLGVPDVPPIIPAFSGCPLAGTLAAPPVPPTITSGATTPEETPVPDGLPTITSPEALTPEGIPNCPGTMTAVPVPLPELLPEITALPLFVVVTVDPLLVVFEPPPNKLEPDDPGEPACGPNKLEPAVGPWTGPKRLLPALGPWDGAIKVPPLAAAPLDAGAGAEGAGAAGAAAAPPPPPAAAPAPKLVAAVHNTAAVKMLCIVE